MNEGSVCTVTASAGIADNTNSVASILWYRGIWPNGHHVDLSEVYVALWYRGSMGPAEVQGMALRLDTSR